MLDTSFPCEFPNAHRNGDSITAGSTNRGTIRGAEHVKDIARPDQVSDAGSKTLPIFSIMANGANA